MKIYPSCVVAQIEAFRALAARDNVTFNAVDLVFEIHAWGGEKVREYLARVYEAVDGSSRS